MTPLHMAGYSPIKWLCGIHLCKIAYASKSQKILRMQIMINIKHQLNKEITLISQIKEKITYDLAICFFKQHYIGKLFYS